MVYSSLMHELEIEMGLKSRAALQPVSVEKKFFFNEIE